MQKPQLGMIREEKNVKSYLELLDMYTNWLIKLIKIQMKNDTVLLFSLTYHWCSINYSTTDSKLCLKIPNNHYGFLESYWTGRDFKDKVGGENSELCFQG